MKRPSVLIIPIVVIAVVSLFYFVFMASFVGYGPSNARFSNVLDLYESMPEASTLFLGDSQVRENIDCGVLECYNLGISGILPLQVALQGQLIKQANPGLVYLGMSPLYFSEEVNVNEDIYFFMGDSRIDSYILQELTEEERELVGMGAIESALYKRKFVLPHYLGLLKGLFVKSEVRMSTDNFKDPWQFSKMQTEESLLEKVNDEQLISAFDFATVSKRQKDTFEYLVKTLSTQVKVVLVKMPLNPLLKDVVDTKIYDSYVETLGKRYGVTVEDYTWSFEEESFVDLTHLNADGRVELSTELGDSDTVQ